MEEEASQRGNKKLTCSRDMIEYVQHMVREHNENYKVRAVHIYDYQHKSRTIVPVN